MNYDAFLYRREQHTGDGFEPLWIPDFLYGFQASLLSWSLPLGRGAIFADCGMGKTPIQLVWAQNVVEHTNRRVLIATPLAVSRQTMREAEKFGVKCVRSQDGRMPSKPVVVVTNYERLEAFDASDFAGMVCDESSILKNFSGTRRRQIDAFMRKLHYRLLCTATAAPNDYVELGTSSEALGYLQHSDMLTRFFKNDEKEHVGRNRNMRQRFGPVQSRWRFKGHAEDWFWRWVVSWARALRRPSDLGFDDDRFVLPELTEEHHIVEARLLPDGALFPLPAISLADQREERRRTLPERCERLASMVPADDFAIVWCHLNDEADLLEKLIPDALQVSGSMPDDLKAERLLAFGDRELRVLVTKPKIGAWGMNYQHCCRVFSFVSHSYEAHYQSVRRCWRYGQKRPVKVDLVLSDGEAPILKNLQRKAEAASEMFDALVRKMNDPDHLTRSDYERDYPLTAEVPAWL